jgi:hypothetical protein
MTDSRPDEPVTFLEDQNARWQRGERMLVEEYLARRPDLHGNAEGLLDLITNEVLLRQQAGETPALEEYQGRFPHLAEALRRHFEVVRALHEADPLLGTLPAVPTLVAAIPPAPEIAPPSIPGYEILGELGRGGMGVVYKARHLTLKRTVALKMILAGGHAGPHELARFRLEAQAVARLQHPNIVQIHDVGEANGRPYCALEFVEGGNLAGKLDNPLPPREAALVVELLARAMQAAHSRNVVHRDLKPANILLSPLPDEDPACQRSGVRGLGTPKITDFGLARQLDSDSGQTQSGTVMGTPSYMAPEQASGQAHQAGPAVDVYALGAILYTCLTARPPFQGKSVIETLDQVRTQEPVPPSRIRGQVPLDLETICLKALAKEPARRYATAADLAADLRRFLNDEPIQARRVGVGEKLWRRVRRNPAFFALTAAVIVLGGVVGVIATRARPAGGNGETDTSADDLREVVADLDRTDPDWRLEQIVAKRKVIPDDQNGALQIAAFRKLAAQMRGKPAEDGQWTDHPTLHQRLQAPENRSPRSRLTEADATLFRTELKRMERALPLARKMREYPSGRFQINFARDAVSTNLQDWSAGPYLADLLRLDALVQIQDGNRPGAVTSCLAMLNVGRAYTDEPLAYVQGLRMIIFHQALQVLERLVAQAACTDTELEAIQRVLLVEEEAHVLVTMARGERGAQHYFLSSLEAGDLPNSFVLQAMGFKDRSEIPSGTDLRRFHVWLLQYDTEFVAIARQPPEKQPPLLKPFDEKRPTAPLAGTLLFDLLTRSSLAAAATTRHLAELRCAAVALAVERYRLAQGAWPRDLAATVPAYLKEVPKDPYDGLPLRYRRTPDGVVVYCLGPDQADNQGKLDRTSLEYDKEGQKVVNALRIWAAGSAGVDIGFQLWDPAKRR